MAGTNDNATGAAKKRNLQLDLLRGISILLVIGAHRATTECQYLTPFANAWKTCGPFGVNLFFVLSGFLISGLLFSEYDRHGRISIGHFLVRRGFKIWPAYLVFIGYLTVKYGFTPMWPNYLFISNYVGPNPARQTWSLCVEEHFYLILPVIFWLFLKAGTLRWIPWVCAGVFLIACPGIRELHVLSGIPVSYFASHIQFDGLVLGVGLRGLAHFYPVRFAKLVSYPLVWLIVGSLLVGRCYLFGGWASWFEPFRMTSTSLAAGALFLGVYGLSIPQPAPTVVAAIAWMGSFSYSIYLWHINGMRYGERFAARLLPESTDAGWLLASMVAILMSVLLGVVAAKLIEMPMLQIRDRFWPSRSGVAVPPAAIDIRQVRSVEAAPSGDVLGPVAEATGLSIPEGAE